MRKASQARSANERDARVTGRVREFTWQLFFARAFGWTVEETAPCFIVRDANKQALAFVYCEDEPGRSAAAKLLTRDEARRIAINIAKLPELLHKPPKRSGRVIPTARGRSFNATAVTTPLAGWPPAHSGGEPAAAAPSLPRRTPCMDFGRDRYTPANFRLLL